MSPIIHDVEGRVVSSKKFIDFVDRDTNENENIWNQRKKYFKCSLPKCTFESNCVFDSSGKSKIFYIEPAPKRNSPSQTLSKIGAIPVDFIFWNSNQKTPNHNKHCRSLKTLYIINQIKNSIIDEREEKAINLLNSLSKSKFRKKKYSNLFSKIFLFAIDKEFVNFCLNMIKCGFPKNGNDPIFYSADKNLKLIVPSFLMVCLATDNFKIATELASPESSNYNWMGLTPLMISSLKNFEITKLLLQKSSKKCSINANALSRLLNLPERKVDFNWSVLDFAVCSNDPEIVRLFKNFTSQRCFLIQSKTQITSELLKILTPLYQVDEFGNTPLHYAVLRENFEVVVMLVKANCNIHAKNKKLEYT